MTCPSVHRTDERLVAAVFPAVRRAVTRSRPTREDSVLDIEERLLRLEDRAEIESRKYTYCRYADALDPARMVSLFTEDCVAFFPGQPVMTGRDRLEAFYAGMLAQVEAGSHHISNVEIDFTGGGEAR